MLNLLSRWGNVRCAYCYTSACFNSSLGAAFGGRIPDRSFSATSFAWSQYVAKHGRLNGRKPAWAPSTKTNSPNDYLQIDLGGLSRICGIATQGTSNHPEWTTKYKISLSVDNRKWIIYTVNGSEKVGKW